MKECPKCNLSLPDEAHFCPRCMYEYPRVGRKQENSKVVNKKKRIIIVGILALAVLALNLKVVSIRREKAIEEQERRRQSLRYMLDTGKNPSIVYDLQRLYVYGYNDITAPMLGEVISEEDLSTTGYIIVREFENVKIRMVRDSGAVSEIHVDYTNADETFKEQYGIGDINGKLRKDDVVDILGEPFGAWSLYDDKEWHSCNEWKYNFNGMVDMPRLLVTFDENGVVTQLEYCGTAGQIVP